MFRSTTIIRELVLNLAKVIFILKHSVKLGRYTLFGDVATSQSGVYVVCCAQHSIQHTHTHARAFVGDLTIQISVKNPL